MVGRVIKVQFLPKLKLVLGQLWEKKVPTSILAWKILWIEWAWQAIAHGIDSQTWLRHTHIRATRVWQIVWLWCPWWQRMEWDALKTQKASWRRHEGLVKLDKLLLVRMSCMQMLHCPWWLRLNLSLSVAGTPFWGQRQALSINWVTLLTCFETPGFWDVQIYSRAILIESSQVRNKVNRDSQASQ